MAIRNYEKVPKITPEFIEKMVKSIDELKKENPNEWGKCDYGATGDSGISGNPGSIKYSDYLAEKLDKTINFSDYLAKNLDKSIDHSVAEHWTFGTNYDTTNPGFGSNGISDKWKSSGTWNSGTWHNTNITSSQKFTIPLTPKKKKRSLLDRLLRWENEL